MSKDATKKEQEVPVMTGVPDQSATITKVSKAVFAVMTKLESIVADAVIEHGDATYASEELVNVMVREAMLREGLILVPSEIESQQIMKEKRQGCQVRMRGKLIHKNSGEWLQVEMAGYAETDSDKALSYALSAVFKSLLLRMFLIPVVKRKTSSEVAGPGPATDAQLSRVRGLLERGPAKGLASDVNKALEAGMSKVQASAWIKTLETDLRRQARKTSGKS